MSTSKNKSKPPAPPVKQAETESAVPTTKATGATLFRWIPYVVLMLGSLLLYANTFHHQYALDDEIVISKNEYVLRGISGFSDIFSKDLFDSFYRQMNTSAQLAGGRYRPLSVASFAVEQEFIGTRENANFEPDCWDFNKNGKKDPAEDVNRDGNYNDKDLKSKGFGLRHVNNALFYGMACCMLFLFLQQIMFRGQFLLPLAISLLFLAHPLHTEVVANVKSRDEIFSLFFMLLSLFAAHRYSILQNMKWLLLTCLSFFCALLSKEYGVTLFILIPLSLYLFNNESFSFKKNIRLWIGMILFFLIYYGIRSTIVQGNEGNIQDSELMNNPFLLADETQKLATRIFIFGKYLFLMLIPHPLCSDYGYNSIPYKDFTYPGVWVSILSMIGLAIAVWQSYRKKSWALFALSFSLLTLLLVTNFIFNIGATMGERLAFHASLGFCIFFGYGMYWVAVKMGKPQILWLFLLPVLILYSMKTISRNKAWENDITLALTDVEINPESIALNGNASSRNLDLSELPANKSKEKEYVAKAIRYGKKAVQLHPGFVNGYLNLGLGYAKSEMYDSAKNVWDIAFRIYPHHPSKNTYYNVLSNAYYQRGFKLGSTKQWKEGAYWIQKAVEADGRNARYWYDLGGFSFNAGDYTTAKMAWEKAYSLNPNDPEIQKVQGYLK